MTDANVSLVQSLYAAFGRGEIETIVNAMSADSTWEVAGRESDFPTLGRRKGPSGVKNFFETVEQNFVFHEFSPKEFYTAKDKVFVLGHYATTLKKTGKPFASDWIHIFTIRNGKVTAFMEFTDTAKVAEAYRS